MFTIREGGSNNYNRSLISDYVPPVVAGCLEQYDHSRQVSPGAMQGFIHHGRSCLVLFIFKNGVKFFLIVIQTATADLSTTAD
jgi:hypothetical protein